MKVKFWGVRGSIPTPLSPAQLQGKISAVIQRIEPGDLKTPETREAFLEGLPPYLFGTIGGNTTCIEIRLSDDTLIILDTGSGIRELGNSLKRKREKIRNFHIFFTHFHWDHIMGLPFFSPQIFDPRNTINFYSPKPGLEKYLRTQMSSPYFPITMDDVFAKLKFNVLEKAPVKIGSSIINWRKMKHPGDSYSYKISDKNKNLIFSSDTELMESDFLKTDENSDYFGNVDLIILDSQYTLNEAIDKYGWGHSSYSLAVDFAVSWIIPKLVLFHHEPNYDDKKIFSIHKSANWYLNHLQDSELKIFLAAEDLEIVI